MTFRFRGTVVHRADVETFADTDRDGLGDIGGLADRLGAANAPGVVTHLRPRSFCPSPHQSDGCGVADGCGVDHCFGGLGDFASFAQAARDGGMRIVLDRLADRTSEQHRWPPAARRDPCLESRNWCVWPQEELPGFRRGSVLPPTQKSALRLDASAQAWHPNGFLAFQPDLGVADRAVLEEFERTSGFWRQLGAPGSRRFRLHGARR